MSKWHERRIQSHLREQQAMHTAKLELQHRLSSNAQASTSQSHAAADDSASSHGHKNVKHTTLYPTLHICTLEGAMFVHSEHCSPVLCCAMLCSAVHPVLCYAMLCFAMLCYAMLCYAMLCYAMLCSSVLCCAMLCYAMFCSDVLIQATLCCARALQHSCLLAERVCHC